jgi:hypothetical protein
MPQCKLDDKRDILGERENFAPNLMKLKELFEFGSEYQEPLLHSAIERHVRDSGLNLSKAELRASLKQIGGDHYRRQPNMNKRESTGIKIKKDEE